MEDRDRLEEYLAWRRAQREQRRALRRRRLRTRATVAAATLTVAAAAVALYGLERPVQQASGRLAAQVPNVDARPLTALPPAPEPAPPASAAVSVGEPTAAPIPQPRSGATGVRREGRQRSVTPAAERRVPATIEAARQGPLTDSGPTPTPTGRSAASRVASDSAEAPRRAAPDVRAAPEVVVTPPPAPPPTVVVEPPPASAPRAGGIALPRVAQPLGGSVTTPAAVARTIAPDGEDQSRVERLKRLTGYIPEVWFARTVARWVKAQPPGELPPPVPDRALPQGR